MSTPVIRVGVIGAGFVGSALIELLSDPTRTVALVDAATSDLEVVGVAVRDSSRPRQGIAADLLTDDGAALAARTDIDILVEVIGGIEPARSYIETALRNGVSVVTANKALIAQCGTALAQLAHENNADLFYEAAVAVASRFCVPCARHWRANVSTASWALSTARQISFCPR